MELMHPEVIKIGIPVLLLAVLILHVIPSPRKKDYTGGLRSGAASLIYNLPIYKRICIRSKVLLFFHEIFVIAALISALFLIARPYETKKIKIGVQKRDIMLCLDVSYSLYELNYELADYLEQVVMELQGDRFGITTFAPAKIPFSRPTGSIVPSAVVAGSSTSGMIRRITESRNSVSSTVPALSLQKGVS